MMISDKNYDEQDKTKIDSNSQFKSCRVIIKNLPRFLISEEKLKNALIEIAERNRNVKLCNELNNNSITDCKILKKRNTNESRRFAFLGFRNVETAKNFIEFFNNTFIYTNKVTANFAVPPKSDLAPEPKSTRTLKRLNRVKERKEKAFANHEKKKQEFLEGITNKCSDGNLICQKSTKTRKVIEQVIPTKAGVSNKRKHLLFLDDDSENEVINDENDKYTPLEDPKNLIIQENTTDKNQKKKLKISVDRCNHDDPKKSKNSHPAAMSNEEIKDEDKVLFDHCDDEYSHSHNDLIKANLKNNSEHCIMIDSNIVEKDHFKNHEGDAIDEGRIMILNLPYSSKENDLYDFCSKFGDISNVHICRDDETGMSKGFGFVTFAFVESSLSAINNLDGSIFQGRIIQCKFAYVNPTKKVKEKVLVARDEFSSYMISSYKTKKEESRKIASRCEKSWNLLYASANSYVNSITSAFDLNKYDFYDFSAENLAVKQTVSETFIINKTKEWLIKEGINVNAFVCKGTELISAKLLDVDKEADDNNLRSFSSTSGDFLKRKFEKEATDDKILRNELKTIDNENNVKHYDTIIIKHLPNMNDMQSKNGEVINKVDRLKKMFLQFGEISRFLLSPSKTVAICKYVHESSGKNAFDQLAYRRFFDSPLFLEFPKVQVFTYDPEKKIDDNTKENHRLLNSVDNSSPNDILDKKHVSLFIKNLSFKTTEESLSQIFSAQSGFLKVNIVKKRRPIIIDKHNTDGQKEIKQESLSVGYGFAEFLDGKHAFEALKNLQGIMVDGHMLELSVSRSCQTHGVNEVTLPNKVLGSNKITRKILVKNLAFEATKKELYDLFSQYGNVRSIRLPKKADGSPRGYAFVEMLSNIEASKVLETLQHSHFYGRHLILEPAKDPKSADTILPNFGLNS